MPNSALTLSPITETNRGQFLSVSVTPDQIKFSGTVAEAYGSAEEGIDFHGIWLGDQPVGFFKIDRLYHTRYPFAGEHGLGLRAFMIDAGQQGQGLATQAVEALKTYIPQHYSDALVVVLTVNMSNPAAIRCYLKGGFEDTGETWPHGEAGPQHIMRMELATEPAKPTLRERFKPFFAWVRRNVPRGMRLFLGILLIIGGIFGFLPILGFWMIPLGVMVAAMDVRLYRRWRSRRNSRK
ncbi:Acetyltransferase (GNAT) family protein [Falsiruegeria litorea R37]|uniref:Acetyltransferase (GNAT) family protein n=1 Tax=Falsiruegeria litorea R37 TaxID=1200284 RepID=A0A1Y5ST04_9RHOB|nr:GNAT family N-acetyltransferase [Falsiruegeria litorea]SLN47651.1 Acetyltransferase (GNAT) family protein [Falsiruegeria litorea R37]